MAEEPTEPEDEDFEDTDYYPEEAEDEWLDAAMEDRISGDPQDE